jgi:UDP-N-acetylmuramoyl-tripeptide--D-alanyl-D-alanine ligase
VDGQEIRLQTPGVHHVGNAAAACAVASVLGIPLEGVADALAEFRAPAMRMEIQQAPDGVTLLNDAYNAAPDSMRAALQTLVQLAADERRAVAVLGEMRELGEFGTEAHRYVGRLAAELGVGLLVTVGTAGENMAIAGPELRPDLRVESFADSEEAAHEIGRLIKPGDVVLVKGSRAMEMEKIVAALADR